MEGAFRLLVALGLLAALLPAAAAATFGPQQPATPCEPTLLATQVALFCAPDMPTATAQCCEPVVAAVDLGGGVPCLCRVAAEPQLVMAGLNATHLLTLYTSCGGLRPGGAHLAAACEGPAPPLPAADVGSPPPSPTPASPSKQPAHEAPPPPPSSEKPSPPPQQHSGAKHSKAAPTCAPTPPLATRRNLKGNCDPFALGGRLASDCADSDSPSSTCCKIVIRTVDEDYCLCQVAEIPVFMLAPMDVPLMWSLYSLCHGSRTIPRDRSDCGSHASPPPPPSSPSHPPPPPDSPSVLDQSLEDSLERLLHLVTEASIGSYVGVGIVVIVCASLLIGMWKLRGVPAHAATAPAVPSNNIELVPPEARLVRSAEARPIQRRRNVDPPSRESSQDPADAAVPQARDAPIPSAPPMHSRILHAA